MVHLIHSGEAIRLQHAIYDNTKSIHVLGYVISNQSIVHIYACRYIDYDDEPTFDDFKPFGGWNKPTMKQYTEDSKECVANLHLDYSNN